MLARSAAASTGNEQLAGQKDGDGVLVDANTTNATLRLNAARRNRRDGIHVLSATTLPTRNGAFANGALGIDAVAGVTVGGGTVAHGNGNSASARRLARPKCEAPETTLAGMIAVVASGRDQPLVFRSPPE